MSNDISLDWVVTYKGDDYESRIYAQRTESQIRAVLLEIAEDGYEDIQLHELGRKRKLFVQSRMVVDKLEILP